MVTNKRILSLVKLTIFPGKLFHEIITRLLVCNVGTGH